MFVCDEDFLRIQVNKVGVSTCVCVCACVHACVCVCVCAYVRACMHACVCKYILSRNDIHLFHPHVCMYIRTYIHIYIVYN